MAKFKTKLTEMCGIEHPIIQGKYPSAQGDNTVVGKHAFTFERILFLYRPLLLLVIFVLSNFF